MFPQDKPVRMTTLKSFTLALACLALLASFGTQAKADTLTVTGSSNSNMSTTLDSFTFVGQTFNRNFNVTAAGQTFDFVFGRFSIQPPGGPDGDFGCLSDPGAPCYTLTGTLTSPAGALSFGGEYSGSSNSDSRALFVDWFTGSGPFVFTTSSGGSGQFTIGLLNFSAINSTTTTQLYDQLARITVTQFTPGAAAPVPEPATLLLFSTGLAAVAARRRKSRKQA